MTMNPTKRHPLVPIDIKEVEEPPTCRLINEHTFDFPGTSDRTLPNGPMDLDILGLEAEAMAAVGIPPQLIPRYDLGTDGHPIPGGGSA